MKDFSPFMTVSFLLAGLIWDRATMHYGERISEWVTSKNADFEALGSRSRLFLAYIDEGLTPIIQVADVGLNRPIKQGLTKNSILCIYDIIHS